MQQWAYETFDGDNIPMCEFTMLKLPEGYNGFFVHMDHRLIDSCGLVVMIGDLFQLYTHYKYGTAYPCLLYTSYRRGKREIPEPECRV